jgi:hypothetical protein
MRQKTPQKYSNQIKSTSRRCTGQCNYNNLMYNEFIFTVKWFETYRYMYHELEHLLYLKAITMHPWKVQDTEVPVGVDIFM